MIVSAGNCVNSLVEVDVFERGVVNAERVLVDASGQEELLLGGDAEVHNFLERWRAKDIKLMVLLNVPKSNCFGRSCKQVLSIFLAESEVGNCGRVTSTHIDVLEVFQIPVLDSAVCGSVGKR